MDPADFDYELPAELIAQRPLPERRHSRLLHLAAHGGALTELPFAQIGALLRPHDLLVFNDTRVIPARLHGRKSTGGRIEMLLERVLDSHLVLAHLRASKSPAAGTRLEFDGGAQATVIGREGEFYRLQFDAPVLEVLEQYGHVPLPPYIQRADEPLDRERYQTVYAASPGAVAAPTAGLHFDRDLLAQLAGQGVGEAFVTLHVASGTFLPLRPEQLSRGELHSEYLQVTGSVCAAVERARAAGGRVIAVGTTVVRALESAAAGGSLRPFEGETRLFIRPGFRFRVVDAMVTNFHLPSSSLLMLVAAFGGTATVLAAYRHAVAQRFRFFSYGDAMFVERRND